MRKATDVVSAIRHGQKDQGDGARIVLDLANARRVVTERAASPQDGHSLTLRIKRPVSGDGRFAQACRAEGRTELRAAACSYVRAKASVQRYSV